MMLSCQLVLNNTINKGMFRVFLFRVPKNPGEMEINQSGVSPGCDPPQKFTTPLVQWEIPANHLLHVPTL